MFLLCLTNLLSRRCFCFLYVGVEINEWRRHMITFSFIVCSLKTRSTRTRYRGSAGGECCCLLLLSSVVFSACCCGDHLTVLCRRYDSSPTSLPPGNCWESKKTPGRHAGKNSSYCFSLILPREEVIKSDLWPLTETVFSALLLLLFLQCGISFVNCRRAVETLALC